jgi:hypothetical protein
MKQLIPILFAGLVIGCTNTSKSESNNIKQPPTATVKGKYVEGGALRSTYIYNHETNSDVIYFSYEYSKDQLDSVYGECTHFLEDSDSSCYGGAAYWYDEKGIRIDLEYGNFNGPNEKWVCAVDMTKGYYTLHISDSLEVKVGDNINDLNLSHHKYVQEFKRIQRNDTTRLHHHVFPYCDCPPFFVIEYKNDTIIYVRYDDICV